MFIKRLIPALLLLALVIGLSVPVLAAAKNWADYAKTYTASNVTTHDKSVKEKYADYKWGYGKHFKNGELLDTSNPWQKQKKSGYVSVPEFNVLIVSNGSIILSHYNRDQCDNSKSLAIYVSAGQSYRLMKANDLGDLAYVTGAFEEAVWYLEQKAGCKKNAGCALYGNGSLLYSFSLTAK